MLRINLDNKEIYVRAKQSRYATESVCIPDTYRGSYYYFFSVTKLVVRF